MVLLSNTILFVTFREIKFLVTDILSSQVSGKCEHSEIYTIYIINIFRMTQLKFLLNALCFQFLLFLLSLLFYSIQTISKNNICFKTIGNITQESTVSLQSVLKRFKHSLIFYLLQIRKQCQFQNCSK